MANSFLLRILLLKPFDESTDGELLDNHYKSALIIVLTVVMYLCVFKWIENLFNGHNLIAIKFAVVAIVINLILAAFEWLSNQKMHALNYAFSSIVLFSVLTLFT